MVRQSDLVVAAACLCLPVSVASSATIVQFSGFNYMVHGTSVQVYNQFNPALGTLTSVTFNGSFSHSESWTVTNNTSSPVSMNLNEGLYAWTDVGFASYSAVVPYTLPTGYSGGIQDVTLTVSANNVTSTIRRVLMTSSARAYSSRMIFYGGFVTSNNPLITTRWDQDPQRLGLRRSPTPTWLGCFCRRHRRLLYRSRQACLEWAWGWGWSQDWCCGPVLRHQSDASAGSRRAAGREAGAEPGRMPGDLRRQHHVDRSSCPSHSEPLRFRASSSPRNAPWAARPHALSEIGL